MNFPIQLSENLQATDACFLHAPDNPLNPLLISFIFFGHDCDIVLDSEDVEWDSLSFSNINGPFDLVDSFEGLLDDHYWPEVQNIYRQMAAED